VPERDRAGNIIRWLAVSTEIDYQKREQERERLVFNELDHRVNNNLTTVLTIAQHTARRSGALDEFLPKFEGRVRSLSLAHKALSANRWQGVRFREFIEQILQGIIDPSVNAITLDGEDILLPTYVAPPLALIVNELAVNALKHGAFSAHASGPVGIRWELCKERFRFFWRESTSLKIDPSTFTGFGMRLIQGLTSHQLGGSAEFRTDDGLECLISVPLRLTVDPFALNRPNQD
jgi:two-component sensor histidine kinase